MKNEKSKQARRLVGFFPKKRGRQALNYPQKSYPQKVLNKNHPFF
jgi:hypothetical protein